MTQLSLFNSTQYLPEDGECIYIPEFLSKEKANLYFESLKETISWEKRKILLFGKLVMQPRLVAWYGDKDAVYSYSGATFKPQAWTKELLEIKELVEAYSKTTFNGVLLNLYRDGQDHMGYHSDNEKELGKEPIIASISLGETRKFHIKHNTKDHKVSFDLEHGSLTMMSGKMQEYWKHMISKTKRSHDIRINLTFRTLRLSHE